MKASSKVFRWDHRNIAPIRNIVRAASQIPNCDAYIFEAGSSDYWLILARNKEEAIDTLKQCIPLESKDIEYIKIWEFY